MTKFLILHGTGATPNDNWFMWLKGRLVGQGHTVWLPQLPDAEKPNPATYTKFLRANKKFVIDSDTIIIGHSSGAVAIFDLLAHLPKKTVIHAAILVSAFKDDLGWESLADLFPEPFDFDVIKSHCQEFIFIHSDNDPHAPLEDAEFLSEKLDGKMIVEEGQEHFSTETNPDFKKFPELLDVIEAIK